VAVITALRILLLVGIVVGTLYGIHAYIAWRDRSNPARGFWPKTIWGAVLAVVLLLVILS
jgi:hypothetical protein